MLWNIIMALTFAFLSFTAGFKRRGETLRLSLSGKGFKFRKFFIERMWLSAVMAGVLYAIVGYYGTRSSGAFCILCAIVSLAMFAVLVVWHIDGGCGLGWAIVLAFILAWVMWGVFVAMSAPVVSKTLVTALFAFPSLVFIVSVGYCVFHAVAARRASA